MKNLFDFIERKCNERMARKNADKEARRIKEAKINELADYYTKLKGERLARKYRELEREARDERRELREQFKNMLLPYSEKYNGE